MTVHRRLLLVGGASGQLVRTLARATSRVAPQSSETV